MKLFRKKSEDPIEQRFDSMLDLIKDLPRADYNRLKLAMDLAYDAYQKVKNIKTEEEREVDDVNKIEHELEGAK